MSDSNREYEEKINKYEAELKEINEDIEYSNNKICSSNKQVTILEEQGNVKQRMSKVDIVSMIYFDVGKLLSSKSSRIRCIQDCKKAIESLTMPTSLIQH